MERNAMYGLVHKGIKELLIHRMGFFDEDEYRNHLSLRTGKASCKELSNHQLRQLIDCLKQEGYLQQQAKNRPRPGGRGPARPTDQQWAKLAALAKERGWSGLEDPGLDLFVERTVKIAKAKFLTHTLISKVILGLERWNAGGGHD